MIATAIVSRVPIRRWVCRRFLPQTSRRRYERTVKMKRALPVRLIRLTVFSVVACLSSQAFLSARSLEYQTQQGLESPLGDISFEPKGTVDGVTTDHFRFSSEIWESSDRVAVFLKRLYCGSPRHAERALHQQTKKASRIVESKILRDKNGTRSGRRIVVSFDGEAIKRPQMILWTHHGMFYSVESSSFQHALIFEKRLPDL